MGTNQGSKRRVLASLRREAWPRRYETYQGIFRRGAISRTIVRGVAPYFEAFKGISSIWAKIIELLI